MTKQEEKQGRAKRRFLSGEKDLASESWRRYGGKMTNQKEIKEGIALHYCEDQRIDYYTPMGRRLGNDYADIEVNRLHSQGVVIKVDIGGGYSDIESLIKEGK